MRERNSKFPKTASGLSVFFLSETQKGGKAMSAFRKGLTSRVLIMGLLVVFLFTADMGRLFYIQIVKGEEYADKAESQQLSDTEI